MSKVSVVVPVYNAKPYLDNCIRSLVNQTLSDIEIILVNDGSKDGSKDIIDLWRKKDSRIVCVNQENQGVTRARKNGVNAAGGEWITFVDADDELPSNALELMLNDVDGYDIVIGYTLMDHVFKHFPRYNVVLSQKEYMHDLLIKESIHWGPVSKLFSKKILDESVFDISRKITNGEDFIFNIRAASKADKIKIIDKDVYHYIYRPGSAVSNNPFKSMRYCLLFEKEVWKSFCGVRRKYLFDYCLRMLKTVYRRFKMIVKEKIKMLAHQKK